jgi:hypothetical protein
MSQQPQNQQFANKGIFFNVVPSPRDERDHSADTLFEDSFTFPKKLDWTNHLQNTRNQGAQGTSLTQAGTCMLEWKSRKLDKEKIQLSPQYIYNNRKDGTSHLMSGRELMKLLTNSGTCSEKLCPYGTLQNNKINSDLIYKIKGYARVLTMDTLKKALTVFGPCLITFPVFNHTASMWKQHKEEERLGGHAMAVIGYNDKGFILRNSWGKHWDLKGNCLYPYSDWGYHYEIWCYADELAYEHYKTKPRLLKLFTKKKSPYLVVSENRMMSMSSGEKEFYIPDMNEISEDYAPSLESQYKQPKDTIRTEKNEMLMRRSNVAHRYLAAASGSDSVPSDPDPEPEPEPEPVEE